MLNTFMYFVRIEIATTQVKRHQQARLTIVHTNDMQHSLLKAIKNNRQIKMGDTHGMIHESWECEKTFELSTNEISFQQVQHTFYTLDFSSFTYCFFFSHGLTFFSWYSIFLLFRFQFCRCADILDASTPPVVVLAFDSSESNVCEKLLDVITFYAAKVLYYY